MKAILRSAVLAVGVASIAVLGTTPVSAHHGNVVFEGEAEIDTFGLGASQGRAKLRITGDVHGTTVVNEAATATFTLNEPAGTCPATGTASGDVTADDGSFSVDFNWSRVGATAVITTTGDIEGTGVAAFAPTSPIGPICGHADVRARFAGALSSEG